MCIISSLVLLSTPETIERFFARFAVLFRGSFSPHSLTRVVREVDERFNTSCVNVTNGVDKCAHHPYVTRQLLGIFGYLQRAHPTQFPCQGVIFCSQWRRTRLLHPHRQLFYHHHRVYMYSRTATIFVLASGLFKFMRRRRTTPSRHVLTITRATQKLWQIFRVNLLQQCRLQHIVNKSRTQQYLEF